MRSYINGGEQEAIKNLTLRQMRSYVNECEQEAMSVLRFFDE